MSRRDELLNSLVEDLQPVAAPPRLLWLGGLWFVCSLVYVVSVTGFLGPLRPGAFDQLLLSPHFLLEMIAGLLTAACLCAAAFQSAVPGRLSRPLLWGASLLGTAWVANFLLGFYVPALETGMLGKRPHCFSETILYALPPLIAGLYWQRRLYALRPRFSAFMVGLAAGILPAWYMQIACMYEPSHILRLHVLPGFLVAVLAVVLMVPFAGRRGHRQ